MKSFKTFAAAALAAILGVMTTIPLSAEENLSGAVSSILASTALSGFLETSGPVHAAGAASNTVAHFRIRAGGVLKGEMDVELFSDKPETTRNFLSYIQSGAYPANVFLHRCISNSIVVVQGGGYSILNPTDPNTFLAYDFVPAFPAIANEFRVGAARSNAAGTIAMAKLGGNPDSATSQWFFNLANNSLLDNTNNNGGFTVFGQVISQTNYTDSSDDLLKFFRQRSKNPSLGIVDLTTFYGDSAGAFSDLPVNFFGLIAPRYSDLFTVEITATNAPDAVLPTITVSQPEQNNQGTIVPTITASGTASDPATVDVPRTVGVSAVAYRVNGGFWTLATGTTNWAATNITLSVGTNLLEFASQDLAGNISPIVARRVIFSTNSVSGTFNGLFYSTNTVTHETSGAFTFTLGKNRSYTATLRLAGLSYKIKKGVLDASYRGTNTITPSGGTPVRVEWQLNSSNINGQLVGRVTDGTAAFNSPLLGNRVVNGGLNPAAFRGTYTMNVAGVANSTNGPAGSGTATLNVDSSAMVTVKGTLADGITISQKVGADGSGTWPFYASPYKGDGSIFGWLTFTNLPNADLAGSVNWFKKANAGGKVYSGGFTNLGVAADGGKYTDPFSARVLSFTNGFVILGGAGLTNTWTNSVTLNLNNRVVSDPTNPPLSVTITTGNGTFAGSFTEPGTKTVAAFRGIVNQKRNTGVGFFLNDNQSGFVYFGP